MGIDYQYRADGLVSRIATTNSSSQKMGVYDYAYDANKNKTAEVIIGAGIMDECVRQCLFEMRVFARSAKVWSLAVGLLEAGCKSRLTLASEHPITTDFGLQNIVLAHGASTQIGYSLLDRY